MSSSDDGLFEGVAIWFVVCLIVSMFIWLAFQFYPYSLILIFLLAVIVPVVGGLYSDKKEREEHALAMRATTQDVIQDPRITESINLMNKGIELQNSNNYNDAIAYYDKALHINPELWEAWYQKGVAYYELKRYDEALKIFKKIYWHLDRETREQSCKEWYNRGLALLNLERYDEAVYCCKVAEILYSYFDEASFQKGWALFKLKKYREALRCFPIKVLNNSKKWSAWNIRGLILEQLERRPEAIQCFKKALDLNCDDVTASILYNNMGYSLGKMGRHKKAIKMYTKALEKNQNYTSQLLNIAESCLLLEEYDEVVIYADKAISVTEKSSEKGLAMLMRVAAFYLINEKEKANQEKELLEGFAKEKQEELKNSWDFSIWEPIFEKLELQEKQTIVNLISIFGKC